MWLSTSVSIFLESLSNPTHSKESKMTLILLNTGGKCEDGEECDDILDELENIDDELDETGIIFVTTEDINFAKKTGIKIFPALIFFRNKEPLTYKGKINNSIHVSTNVKSTCTVSLELHKSAV